MTVFAVLLLFSSSVVHARHADPHAPKRANFFLSLTLTESDAMALSRWDLVVLNMEQQSLNPDLIRRMRKRNPHIRIFAHVSLQEVVQGLHRAKESEPLRYRLWRGIAPEWYLRSSSGERLSWWPGTYLLNVTDRAPLVGGQRWQDYLATFVSEEILETGLWDGIFFDNTWDNITYFAGTDVDLDGDGLPDLDADVAWRRGIETVLDAVRVRSARPIFLVGNNDTLAYQQQLNGMLIENFGAARWSHLMNRYAANVRDRRTPRINIINANTNNTGQQDDYRTMRFGYTSSLLEDGYYSFDFGDQNHGQLWWYDEYDVNLGAPERGASSASGVATYEPDVWQRPYDRGLVVVNSTDVPQHVALGADYEKILGEQDPRVNDGSIVRSLSVDGEDGVILLKLLQTVDETTFRNGSFARFIRSNGTRARNGFFLFEESRRGGDVILRTDLDGNGRRDLVVASGPRLFAWRDDGQLYLRLFPYTAQFRGNMRIAAADVTGDGFKEIIVTAEAGYPAPVNIYSRHGSLVRSPWYPFGQSYASGMTVAVDDLSAAPGVEFVIGSVQGGRSHISMYDNAFSWMRSWHPFGSHGVGVPSITTGNVFDDETSHIVVGSGEGTLPRIRIYTAQGQQKNGEIIPYTTSQRSGVEVGVYDADFDGVDDIVATNQHGGF